jgi:hypothetical protein
MPTGACRKCFAKNNIFKGEFYMNNCNRKVQVSIWVVVLGAIFVLASAMIIFAAGGNVPNVFSSGTTISSSQVNANFTELSNAIPRMKSVYSSTNVSVTSSYQNVASVTVTPKMNGSSLIFAVANVRLDQSIVGSAFVQVCVTTNSNSSGGGDCSNVTLDTKGTHATILSVPVTIISPSASFTANTPATYYLTAMGSGDMTVQGGRITVLFIPEDLP